MLVSKPEGGMHLILGVIGENAGPLGRNARQAFGPEGGSLGRGGGCNWRLPDPTNTLSGRHALIAFNGIGFTITDTSTNGVYINTVDAPLGRGNTAPLTDGDTLYMASYIISVMIENGPAEERHRLELTGSNAARLSGTPRTLPSPSFAQGSPSAPLPTAGLLGSGASLSLDPLMVIGQRRSSYSAAQREPQATHPLRMLADQAPSTDMGSVDPDLLADLPQRLSSAAGTEMQFSHALLEKSRSIPLSSVEAPLLEPSQPPPLALSDGGGASSNGHPAPIILEDLDLSDLLPGAPSRGMPPVPAQRTNARLDAPNEALQVARKPLGPPLTNDLGRLRGAGTSSPRRDERELDRSASPKEVARRPVGSPELRNTTAITAPPLPAASPSDADELQEFWNALGFNADLVPPAQRREFFAELGRALAEMANGLHSILAAWTMVKNECHIGSTLLRADNDNAFKFTKGNHDALREALAKDHGFLLLSRSVREGFNDIKAHEVAAIAAMRGAVSNVLTHMSPQRIESDGVNSRRFGARVDKATLWDRFVELHASMVNDIDRTARTYIAEEFTRSYVSQLSAIDQDEGKTTDGAAEQTSSVVRR
ncbi:type VI secretion system-associated FHA domain protein TagH [Bradyrhizobium sp. BWA-3-5]|uniref:type VI secretion system-associated FHA domain protein TagH n=1 Tax=Bradyrhizobium sp. BWA-3-5 TaxID=3080013 RepID=UPI00293F0B84|nr:type VI secretion system-associated FHA domain protein TagH [Bradyrhizobium sp. BWA-3-5]WOH63792.1 type VI secretion system-associated FHA domain protein TagH [Bradyrhizobium sp. BWA-3-5]